MADDIDQVRASVKAYYGETLTRSADLKTSACCPADAFPEHLKPLLKNIHPDVLDRFYGCGSPVPFCLEGRTILDLGCGTGRDVYLMAQRAGVGGHVIGVDMTEGQLVVAHATLPWHRERLDGLARITFHHGTIEDLRALGIADDSVDVVTSNCVINLSGDKLAVFREIFRVLKPGGELYFSDIFASRRVPDHLARDPEVLGECLGGALYWEDFRRLMRAAGCLDVRVMSNTPITLDDPEIARKVGMIDFSSVTVRAFKAPLEDQCEDFGHVVTYKGSIPETPHAFRLDDHHLFRTGMPERVCGNTWMMLMDSRYAEHFSGFGTFDVHYGLFPCGPAPATDDSAAGCC